MCIHIWILKTLNYLHNIEDTFDFSSYSILGEVFPYLTENLRKCSLQNVKDYIKYMHKTAAQVVKHETQSIHFICTQEHLIPFRMSKL